MEGAPGDRAVAPKQGSGVRSLACSREGAQASTGEVNQVRWYTERLPATGSVRCRFVPSGFLSREAQKVVGLWELCKEPTPSDDDTGRSCHGEKLWHSKLG